MTNPNKPYDTSWCKFRIRFWEVAPIVTKSGRNSTTSTFFLKTKDQTFVSSHNHFKCTLKSHQNLGNSNINLTMEYIQEDEEYPTQVLDEEERNSFLFIKSGQSTCENWQYNSTNLEYLCVSGRGL